MKISSLDIYKNKIVAMYATGSSTTEIKKALSLSVTVRQVQRYLSKLGLIRSKKEALALSKALRIKVIGDNRYSKYRAVPKRIR